MISSHAQQAPAEEHGGRTPPVDYRVAGQLILDSFNERLSRRVKQLEIFFTANRRPSICWESLITKVVT